MLVDGSPNRLWARSIMSDTVSAEPDWALADRLACCRNWSTTRVVEPIATPPPWVAITSDCWPSTLRT